MRNISHLVSRSVADPPVSYVYRWLFSRAQYLLQLRRTRLSSSKSRSLFGIFRSLICQYHRHVPLEYLCGSAMFFNRLFIVNRHVLIPRRDTECLVHHVQQLYQENPTKQVMLDIGTGSGCLPITLSHKFLHWDVHACDVSGSALRIARNNAYLHRCPNIRFHRGDVFDPKFLENCSFSLIISNPPYIPKEEIPMCDRGIFHEPAIALFVDRPLKFYSEIIYRAMNGWLEDDGYLVFECSPFNVLQIEELFIQNMNEFQDIDIKFDSNNLARVISARKRKTS